MSMRSQGLLVSTILIVSCSSSSNNNDSSTVGGGNDSSLSFDAGQTGDLAGGGDVTTSGFGTDAAADGAGEAVPTFTQVYAVITSRCMPCHTTATGIGVTMGHLDMTSKANAFMNLVNTPAAGIACAGKGTRVTPGVPDSSVMYLKVSLDDPSPCGAKMPFGLAPISQEEADTIENWIKGGAKND